MSGHDEFESPVDEAGSGPALEASALKWTTIVIATASLFLLATNAVTVRGWIDEMEPGPFQARLADVAAQWEDFTGSLGLGAPRAALNRQWKAAQAARFDGNEVSEPQR